MTRNMAIFFGLMALLLAGLNSILPISTFYNIVLISGLFTSMVGVFVKSIFFPEENAPSVTVASDLNANDNPHNLLGFLPAFRAQNNTSLKRKIYENVEVIRNFMGKVQDNVDLRQFDSWYSQDMLHYLLHETSNQHNAIRAVFTYPDFVQEITQFKMLLSSLKRPAIFISSEPGAAQNHFIMGVISQNTLLLINPVGLTSHTTYYETVNALLKQNIFSEIILTNTVFQRDPKGLVSCGPLCLELAKFFSEKDIPHFLEVIKAQAIQTPQKNYKTVDLSTFLTGSLDAVFHSSPQNYQAEVIQIRQNHLERLFMACTQHSTVYNCNEYFESLRNDDAQALLRQLVLKDFNIIQMLDSPYYVTLNQKLSSRSVNISQ